MAEKNVSAALADWVVRRGRPDTAQACEGPLPGLPRKILNAPLTP